jgi:uncharacterized Tic20 family protein
MTGNTPPTSPPPGWYPDQTSQMRWWDGQQWGVAANDYQGSTPGFATGTAPNTAGSSFGSDSRSMAMLAHLLAIFTGFIGPLVIYLTKGQTDPFVRHHAAESLNFQITVVIAAFVSLILFIVLIGIIMLPVVIIGALVLEIVGAVRANAGEWWRYPVNIRLVPGAVG